MENFIKKNTSNSRELEKIKYLNVTEIDKILRIARRSIRDYAILAVSYYHGLRISECSILQFDYFDLDSGRLYIKRVKNGISATYKVSEEVSKALKNWIKIRGNVPGPMFLSTRTSLKQNEFKSNFSIVNLSVSLTRSGLDQLFRKYARKAGIDEEKQHFHVLRHSIAVGMVEKDIPLIRIKDWLGHRNIQSTMIYAQVSDRTRDSTQEMLGEMIPNEKGIIEDKNKVSKISDWKRKDKRK